MGFGKVFIDIRHYKNMPKNRKSNKGKLIKGVLLDIPSDNFEAVGKELKEIIHEKPGIYALYKEDKLYYVGLASSLYGRVKWHLKDKHAGKWDHFSIFIVKSSKYLKDLETAIITIAEPKGNSIKGSIPNQSFLKRLLRRRIKDKRKLLKEKMRNKNEEIKDIGDSIQQIEEAISEK